MLRLSRGVVVVLALWCSAAGGFGCKRARPGPCPAGHTETRVGDRGIWCQAEGGAQAETLYLELHSKDGPIRQRCRFSEGRPDGPFEAFHKNGKTWITGKFSAGQVDGSWVQVDENGRQVAKGEYRQGRIVQGAPVAIAAVCPHVAPP